MYMSKTQKIDAAEAPKASEKLGPLVDDKEDAGNPTARHFCFTINNPSNQDINALETVSSHKSFKYMVFGREIAPTTGTMHLQGYIELNTPSRRNALRILLGGRAALFKRYGSREQARNYCMKEGKYIEIGKWDPKGQGARTDLESLMELIREDVPQREIMELLPNTFSRHMKFAEKYLALVERDASKDFRKIHTTVIHGSAGKGKSRIARELEEAAGGRLFVVNTDETFPFDGYDGEDAIILDDFYGGLKHHFLLNVLDGYQLRVNVKGSHRYARWTRVYITSNDAPEQWYARGVTPALARRLHKIINIDEIIDDDIVVIPPEITVHTTHEQKQLPVDASKLTAESPNSVGLGWRQVAESAPQLEVNSHRLAPRSEVNSTTSKNTRIGWRQGAESTKIVAPCTIGRTASNPFEANDYAKMQAAFGIQRVNTVSSTETDCNKVVVPRDFVLAVETLNSRPTNCHEVAGNIKTATVTPKECKHCHKGHLIIQPDGWMFKESCTNCAWSFSYD